MLNEIAFAASNSTQKKRATHYKDYLRYILSVFFEGYWLERYHPVIDQYKLYAHLYGLWSIKK